ncbi:uncharacterized protein LOC127789140 [Diospyros lotus]|uniref:uncharacterized protein LOC127789140 n=1 Tax=Diospyros lotus TaxID=55363 RepID=UPI002253747D|nr:uncharacterized protein LOC127789140 [Diospyros lotus]
MSLEAMEQPATEVEFKPMEQPANEVEFNPEKLEEVKEAGPQFHCDLCDTEIVHKMAQEFLPGLASACVDNTTGGLFRSPASVAVDMRKEMVEYLTQRSETFVAESVVLDGGPEAEVSDHPYDIISNFIDDFSSSKRNFFSKVSGWVLSERREDRIDDFVQEMELNGFWLLERREAIAQSLLKNVDFKNTFHCSMTFNSEEELSEHKPHCGFRTLNCMNEGCTARFSAAQLENHDSVCPFKILPCEQKCADSIMRREMDRHCITICPMKIVNCPFFSVGCQSSIPQSTSEQHRLESLPDHVLYTLQSIHKDIHIEDLKKRAEQVEKASTLRKLTRARDVRSMTTVIKEVEVELGPIEITPRPEENPTETEAPNAEEENTQLPTNKEEGPELLSKKEEGPELLSIKEEGPELLSKKEEVAASSGEKEEALMKSPSKKDELMDSGDRKEDHTESSITKEDRNNESGPKAEECTDHPIESKSLSVSTHENGKLQEEEFSDFSLKDDDNTTNSATKTEESTQSTTKLEEHKQFPTKQEELSTSL